MDGVQFSGGWHVVEFLNERTSFIWNSAQSRLKVPFSTKNLTVRLDRNEFASPTLTISCNGERKTYELLNGPNILGYVFPPNHDGLVLFENETFVPAKKNPSQKDARILGLCFKAFEVDGIGYQPCDVTTDISSHSAFVQRMVDVSFSVQKTTGNDIVKPEKQTSGGAFNLASQATFLNHRSGWPYALSILKEYHDKSGVIFDGNLEKTFSMDIIQNRRLFKIPYRKPWVGVFHNPPNVPLWVSNHIRSDNIGIIKTKEFQESLPYCKGIYVLSRYHAEQLCKLLSVRIEVLPHPTELNVPQFDYEKFLASDPKKIVSIGGWLRRQLSIHRLNVCGDGYEKLKLGPIDTTQTFWQIEQESDGMVSQAEIESVRSLPWLNDSEYDELLTHSIGFSDYFDLSVSNAILECMARSTPILVNYHPAAVEYLGKEYPFFYTSLSEAKRKLLSLSCIKETHEYLKSFNIREKITPGNFRKTLAEGKIYSRCVSNSSLLENKMAVGFIAVDRPHMFDVWFEFLMKCHLPLESVLYIVDNTTKHDLRKFLMEKMSQLKFKFLDVRILKGTGGPYVPPLGKDVRTDPESSKHKQFNVASNFNILFEAVDEPYVYTFDDDTIPPTDAVVKLFEGMIDTDAAGICGLTVNHTSWNTYGVSLKKGWGDLSLNFHHKERFLKAATFGTACTLWKTGLVKKCLPLEPYQENQSWWSGPDHDLCSKLTLLGNSLYVDTSIECQHV